MKRTRLLPALAAALGLGLACLVPPVQAAEDKKKEEQPDFDDTVSGIRPSQIKAGVDKQAQVQAAAEWDAMLAPHLNKEFPPEVYLGAKWLSVDPEFIHDCRRGLEMIYLRDYKGAKAHFDGLGTKYRGMAVGPVGNVLIWQALMLENFDFKYESQYTNTYRRARQELEESIAMPGNDAWEYFLLGGVLGIDSIHTMRKEEYLTALNRGYEAMKSVKKCQELAPEFVDIQLGDGLFNYWVTVISQASKAVPDIGDRRAEGIEQMKLVQQRAVFLSAPATLALTFTWIEEGQRRQALSSAVKNYRLYPDNVINNLVLGRVYMYNRMYKDSERIFNHIKKVAPDNQRVFYYAARLYLRWNKLTNAQQDLDRYLAFTDISDEHRAAALYYYGNIFYRQKQYKKAEKYYKQAWKLGKIERAKRRLDRIAQKK